MSVFATLVVLLAGLCSSVGPCVTWQVGLRQLLVAAGGAVTGVLLCYAFCCGGFDRWQRTLVYVTLDPPRFDVRLSTDESSLFLVAAAYALKCSHSLLPYIHLALPNNSAAIPATLLPSHRRHTQHNGTYADLSEGNCPPRNSLRSFNTLLLRPRAPLPACAHDRRKDNRAF
jgi:hypothetical protein